MTVECYSIFQLDELLSVLVLYDSLSVRGSCWIAYGVGGLGSKVETKGEGAYHWLALCGGKEGKRQLPLATLLDPLQLTILPVVAVAALVDVYNNRCRTE